jgi:excisionase family DNA binding protein
MNEPANIPRERTRLLTVQQAAHVLAVSKRTLERLIASGDFPRPLKIGRSSRVSSQDVESYLAQLVERRALQK